MVNGPSERMEEKPRRSRAGAGLLGAGRLLSPLAAAVSDPGVLGSSPHRHLAKPGGTRSAPCQQTTTRQAGTGLKFWLEILPNTHTLTFTTAHFHAQTCRAGNVCRTHPGADLHAVGQMDLSPGNHWAAAPSHPTLSHPIPSEPSPSHYIPSPSHPTVPSHSRCLQ